MILYLNSNSTNFQKYFSAKEKYLIYDSLNPLKILSPQPKVRVQEVLSHKGAANEHIDEMHQASALEMQKPIAEIKDGIWGAINKIIQLPKAVWERTKDFTKSTVQLIPKPIAAAGSLVANTVAESSKLLTKVTGGTLGFIVNAPRHAWDATISLAGKIPTILGDKGGKLLGLPSRMIEKGKEKLMKKIDSGKDTVIKIGQNIRDRALAVIGAAEGGHGATAAAH